MTRTLRYLGLAALCALWAASAAAQTTSTTTTTSAQSRPRRSPRESRQKRARRRNLLRRHWTVVCADRRVLGHGKWSVSGYRRGTNYIQGFSNVSDVAGTFAVGIRDRAEIFGSFLVDTRIDRDLRPLFIDNTDVGGHRRSRPAGAPGLDRRQRRRLLSGREDQPVVGVPPAAGGAGVPRDGEAADRRRGRGRVDREGRFPVRLHRQQGASGSASSSRGRRGTKSGASPMASTFRAARSGGAWARASRRAPPCAPRSSSSGRSPTDDVATIASGLVVGERRQHPAGDLGDAEPDAGERRAHVAASERLLHGPGVWPGTFR